MKNILLALGLVIGVGLLVICTVWFLLPYLTYLNVSADFSKHNPGASISRYETSCGDINTIGITGEVHDISMLKKLPLIALSFEHCTLDFDLGDLNSFPLDALHIEDAKTPRIETIQHLTVSRLYILSLIHIENLSDLSFLKNCSPIEHLFLNDNTQIKNFEQLKDVQVHNLSVINTNLDSVEKIANPKLRSVNIMGTPAANKQQQASTHSYTIYK